MPWLDVTEALIDPYFNDSTLQVERRTQTVGEDGNVITGISTFGFNGVVEQDGGKNLFRPAEGERNTATITIHTTYALIEGEVGYDADIVIWLGNRFTVTHVDPYSTYGRGFRAASCELIVLSGGV